MLHDLPPRLGVLDTRIVRPEPKRAEPFYQSAAWRSLVQNIIARRGRRCEDCGKTHEADGSPVKLIGDHTVERRHGGADLDETNVRLLCARSGGNGRSGTGACHAAKTARVRAEWLASR